MSEALQARLAALRAGGAGRRDPVRFRTLEALARRLEGQAEPVRVLLQEKLAAGLGALEQGASTAPPVQPALRRTPAPAAVPTPLAVLNAHLRDAAAARAAAAAPGEPVQEHELPSARRFRQAWQATRTVEQVALALARKPSNAGPLNSHALVLHSLERMRALSPAYLRRFLTVVETLQWLEQARDAPPAPRARAAARPRRKRSG